MVAAFLLKKNQIRSFACGGRHSRADEPFSLCIAAMKSSTFKYASIKESKQVYVNLPLETPSPTSASIAASAKFVATQAVSSGRVMVIPTDFSEYKATNTPSTLLASGAQIKDLSFSPFSDTLLATVSADESVKLWEIPRGGLEADMSNPSAEIACQGGELHSLSFHPLVANLAAVGGKSGVQIVDPVAESQISSFDVSGYGKDIVTVVWDYYGKQVACIGKDYRMSLFDPRSADTNVLGNAKKSGRFRPQAAAFMGSKNYLVATGVNSSRQPVVQCYDPRMMGESFADEDLEMSPGYTMPLYDPDTRILYITLRGSGMVRMFDCSKTILKKRDLVGMSKKILGKFIISGCCLAPKFACDVTGAEIAKIYARGKNSILPISVTVPKKVEGFHSDLYPNSLSNQPSTVDSKTWASGSDPKPQLLKITADLKNFLRGDAKAQRDQKDSQVAAQKQEETKAAEKTIQKQMDSVFENKVASRIQCKLRRTAFTHLGGREPTDKAKAYFDLKVTSKALRMSQNLDLNSKFIAFPWKTSGGSGVAVIPRSRPLGRTSNPVKVRGHTEQVSCFALSRLQPDLMATGAPDAMCKVWRLSDPLGSKDLTESVASFECSGKLLGVDFHPRATDVLLTYSMAFDQCHMRLWDIKEKKEKVLIDAHGSSEIMFASFNVTGSLIATTAKDKKVRIINARDGKVQTEFAVKEAQRDCFVFFLDESDRFIVTVGFASGGTRQVSLWDTNSKTCLCSEEIEGGSGALMPILDRDTRTLYVASAGSPSVLFFLLSTEKPYIETLGRYKGSADFKGFSMVPKTELDVKSVQVNRGYRLSKDRITSISFTIPRRRSTFFQDDIFVPTLSPEPGLSGNEWFTRAAPAKEKPVYVSLCPKGMTPVSEAPEEKLTDRQKAYQKRKLETKKPKEKGCLGHETADQVRDHFRGLADMVDGGNRWDAGDGAQDDSDWSDSD